MLSRNKLITCLKTLGLLLISPFCVGVGFFFKQWQGREIGLFLAVIIYIFLFFRASTFYKKTIMSLLFIHFCIINGFIAFSFFMVALNASGW